MSKYIIVGNDELYHHGIKGQKWGIRRYQNEDGTYTDAGNERYGRAQYNRDKGIYGSMAAKRMQKKMQDSGQSIQGLRSQEARRIAGFRKAAKIGGIAGGVAGGVGGFIGGKILEKNASNLSIGRVSTVGNMGKTLVKSMSEMGILKILTGGAGAAAGKAAAQAAVMGVGGYAPNRYKDPFDYAYNKYVSPEDRQELEKIERMRDITSRWKSAASTFIK